MLFAFDEVVNPSMEQVRWAVAYSTRKGCERLIKRVADRIGQSKWDDTKKTFVTSFDFGLTDPAALEFLASQKHSEVHVANAEVHLRPGFRPAQAYHPKLYLFDDPKATGYVVGSANLTASALISNTEVVSAGFEIPGNSSWNDAWTELFFNTQPLTQNILRDYKKTWSRPKLRAVDPDPKPKQPVIIASGKNVFWDAIERGGVDPMLFNHFWVEAGSMPNGGSHNQLELPRGADRFFGMPLSQYSEAHIIIGKPPLTLRGRVWRDRPLTWHGAKKMNKMERINLPTLAQGGFDYRHTAILFRRHEEGFEINVLPWDDDAAIAWRAASEALGIVFRLGKIGARICGLF
ncbi:MAG: phospholipase D family protein [Verrucomicrobiota bacterium]